LIVVVVVVGFQGIHRSVNRCRWENDVVAVTLGLLGLLGVTSLFQIVEIGADGFADLFESESFMRIHHQHVVKQLGEVRVILLRDAFQMLIDLVFLYFVLRGVVNPQLGLQRAQLESHHSQRIHIVFLGVRHRRLFFAAELLEELRTDVVVGSRADEELLVSGKLLRQRHVV